LFQSFDTEPCDVVPHAVAFGPKAERPNLTRPATTPQADKEAQ
jgi:hypothetical protein